MTASAPDLCRELDTLLAAGGCENAAAEAVMIVAHVCAVPRSQLAFTRVSSAQQAQARELAQRRAATGTPLQYLLGRAVSGALDLAVGPGVFIPRPETELLVAWALEALPPPAARPGCVSPILVDLCAGSGTLALEIAHARRDVHVHAVELDPGALKWLRRNAAERAAAGDRPITVHAGDATDAALLASLRGTVDVVVSNPPYIPAAASLPAEVSEHEPNIALYGGTSGNDVIARLVPVMAELLRPGGQLGCEHDDATGAAVAGLFAAHESLGRVKNHNDLAGRQRFVTAARLSDDGPDGPDRAEGTQ